MKLLTFGLAFIALVLPGYAQESKYPAPKNVGNPATVASGIERTMTLLATSTPERRNTVRILFYGQSITEQSWWKIVADDLKRRFPHANLVIENRALGGYSSQLLVKAAETDLYTFYPDLMIFYVYGSHIEYENIIRRTRERTTAEILIQTDHATTDDCHTEETNAASLYPNGKIWNAFMNYKFLPETAKKYGCAVVDQRNLWKQYLKENNLPAKALLRDGVHLNDHGCYLMGEYVKACLVAPRAVKMNPMDCEPVKTYRVGQEVKWENGKILLEFEGNRVDLVVKDGTGQPAAIRIDGKKPSELPEAYALTRACVVENANSRRTRGKWPALMDLSWEAVPQLEEWTLQAAKDATNPKLVSFSISGSKTGPDGEGRSDQRFVSKSRRVVIDPEDWHLEYALSLAGVKPVPEAFTVKWQVVPLFVDEFVPPSIKDRTVETTVTVVQGIKNGRHKLEIAGEPGSPIEAIRVYRPTWPAKSGG